MTTAELATRILSQLGFSTAVTMEPSADYRRDKIVEMIEEQKAQWLREVAEGFQEAFSDAMQSDFENGVKWLNEECVKEFKQKYPEIWDTIGMIARMAEQSESN